MINAPFDTPVGALVSILGVPVFFALTFRKEDVYKRQFLICNESNGDTDRDEKWTEIIGGMTIYKDIELKAHLEQAGFHDVQIHKKKGWLCVTARK